MDLQLNDNLKIVVTNYTYHPETSPTLEDPGSDAKIIVEEWEIVYKDGEHIKEDSPLSELLDWSEIEYQLYYEYKNEL